MTKIFLKLIALSCVIVISQCGHLPKDSGSILGQYDIVAHDNAGRRAFTGTISLTALEQTGASGQCKIVRDSGAAETILDQSPRCQAVMNGENITIDLAPSLDDGGLILEGKRSRGQISGSWRFKSISGGSPQGKFEAAKKE